MKDARPGVNTSTRAHTTRNASESSLAARTRASNRQTSAILEPVSACSLVNTPCSLITVKQSRKMHSARRNTSNPQSGTSNPARLNKCWMLDRTIRCCSRPEDEAEGISPIFQAPSLSSGTIRTDTTTPPGEGPGYSSPTPLEAPRQRR